MEFQYEEVAAEFVQHPIDILGVYKTTLQSGDVYPGHKNQPTTKCALLFALRGQASFIFNGKQVYNLTPGKAILGGLNACLEIVVGTTEFDYFLIHYLPSSYVLGYAPHMTSVSELNLNLDPPMLQMMDRLIQIAAVPGNMELLEKKALFYSLLNRVLLFERNQQNRDNYPIIEQARQYIHEHYMESITLESISHYCDMKEKYFSYLFHKYTGIGPINYLIQYRLNKALELLVNGHSSVREIAKGVGYADAYYFSRLFKKYKGVSPNHVKMFGSRNNPS